MKRILSLSLVAVFLLLSLVGCNKDGNDTTSSTTGSVTTTTTGTTALSVPAGYNILTGENSLAENAPTRPVGVMIANDSLTIGNQAGIDKADVILECETEGAIPRLLAMFASSANVPKKLGPIRSARSPFVATARAFDLVYSHAGGSGPALSTMKTGVLDHFDALADSNTFWRDPQLKAAMDTVHSVATSGEKLTAKLEKSSYSTTLRKKAPWNFGSVTGSGLGTKVQLKTTPSHTVTFIYDDATKTYGKNIGKMESCKPHKSIEGNQIKVANVIVLYAEKYVEGTYDNGTVLYNFRSGKGNGYVISGGTSRAITFDRTDDSLVLTEENGGTVQLATGKTYICLADKNLASNIIFS